MIAAFDSDGVCVAVGTSASMVPPGGTFAEVPHGTRPERIWWDGSAVQPAADMDLPIPDCLTLPGDQVTIALPAGVVADVNGVRQRGQLVLTPEAVGELHISVRGAMTGSHCVRVQSYVERRKEAYPPLGDQLDALWKWMNEHGAAPPAETQAMLETVMAVKTAIPKPQGGE